MLVWSLITTFCSVADNNQVRKWRLLTKKSRQLIALAYSNSLNSRFFADVLLPRELSP